MNNAIVNIKVWQFCFIAVLSTVLILQPGAAFAGNQTGWSTIGAGLCMVAQEFQGQVAAAIATIAICTLGALACLGRVQWTSAIVVAVGIAILFGAAGIVFDIGGVGIYSTSNCYDASQPW